MEQRVLADDERQLRDVRKAQATSWANGDLDGYIEACSEVDFRHGGGGETVECR